MKHSFMITIGLISIVSSVLALPTSHHTVGSLITAPDGHHVSEIAYTDKEIQPILAKQTYPVGIAYDLNGLPILIHYNPILVQYPWVNSVLIPNEVNPTEWHPPAGNPKGADDDEVSNREPVEIPDDVEAIETNVKH